MENITQLLLEKEIPIFVLAVSELTLMMGWENGWMRNRDRTLSCKGQATATQ